MHHTINTWVLVVGERSGMGYAVAKQLRGSYLKQESHAR